MYLHGLVQTFVNKNFDEDMQDSIHLTHLPSYILHRYKVDEREI